MNGANTQVGGELAAILEGQFSKACRKRGEEYFEQKYVTIESGSSTEVRAHVAGLLMYKVSLQWSGGKLTGRCTCPFFADRDELCKHLWATVLASAEHGHLSAVVEERAAGLPRQEAPAHTAVRIMPSATWKKQLSQITAPLGPRQTAQKALPAGSEIVYLLDEQRSETVGALMLNVMARRRSKDGRWVSAAKSCPVSRKQIASLPVADDREILSLLTGIDPVASYGYYGYERAADSFALAGSLVDTLLPRIVRTNRCFLRTQVNNAQAAPLHWDDGEAWRFALEMTGSRKTGWQLTGQFLRGEERIAAKDAVLASPQGILVTSHGVAHLLVEGSAAWMQGIRQSEAIAVTDDQREEFLGSLLCSPGLPPLHVPPEYRYETVALIPQPCLKIQRRGGRNGLPEERMGAELSFAYGDRVIAQIPQSRGVYNAATRQFIVRDPKAEEAAAARLQEVGIRFTPDYWGEGGEWKFMPGKLPHIVRALMDTGWQVIAEGKLFRRPGEASATVASGVDWFELQGSVAYGDTSAPLPQLLAALKKGETMVLLDDGNYGLLPEEWLRQFGQVAGMGELDGDRLRFRPSQAGLLDALLATQPAVQCDETFQRVRAQLAQFASVVPAEQPAGFQGTLREYQREGLGWMHFLRQFSFGGCLADDMGVGKTAQVLALLESRRVLRAEGAVDAPSLVVVPKSLIFNWKQESQRFTPLLRILDYTGIGRGSRNEFSSYDCILTTYGTLRRDAVRFKDQVFDYIVLDEAQAIKNAKTESAKAARLLRGNHRLAMSGTPVENHLGELWSLFEFLNPGMLGSSGAFSQAGAARPDVDGETRKLLAQALRPFLLRRTKEQVAKELPAKVEQTIYCELEPAQRTLYNELRDHYRDSLLHQIGAQGMGKSKIQVLEALLRLRQAACHPGLVDRKRVNDPSAKMEVLLEQLQAVLEEGHKALVFSQFTSLLAILRKRLQGGGIDYEYLDGKTVDRQARVERFQQDAECRLFLISLKAGGVGLNLTAADYVFILDPWWNPAVEAQAIDRTHRIGQERQVFAYRLIARDTVEEKVLQLQETKRNLADAIIGAENSLIREITREDVELLLS